VTRLPCVVVRGIRTQHVPEMLLSEDQHAVREFGADGQHEALGKQLAEVHDEDAGLLGGPGPLWMCDCHADDVHVTVVDLECEQDLGPAQRHRAVEVEENLTSHLSPCSTARYSSTSR
jgi:hypothetical protein